MYSEEYDSSDKRSVVSSESSVADEHLRRNGKRKPHGDKSPVYDISLHNVRGNVAVGSRSARVVNTQAKGDEYPDSTQSLVSPSTYTSLPDENSEFDLIPEEKDPIVPGLYCSNSHPELQFVNKGAEWKPEPGKAIVINKDWSDTSSIDSLEASDWCDTSSIVYSGSSDWSDTSSKVYSEASVGDGCSLKPSTRKPRVGQPVDIRPIKVSGNVVVGSRSAKLFDQSAQAKDWSDTSSIDSLEASDVYLLKPGRLKPRVNKPVYHISLNNVSGNVAVGSRSAKVNFDQGAQAKDDTYEYIPYADPLQSEVCGEEREYDRVPEETVVEIGVPIPGSYCLNSHSELLFIDREAEWKPGPSKGIRIKKGDEEFRWSIESFLKNPDAFIDDMDKTADTCKEQREQFILLTILPHLERDWGKCSISNAEIYTTLAKISCSVNSGIVVRCSLQLFLHLIYRENVDSGNDYLPVVEDIVRSSIFSSEGKFRKNNHSEQALKLFVYSLMLSLRLIQRAQGKQFPIVALEQYKKVQEELTRHCKGIKKDHYKYSMEVIIKTISYLLKPQKKSKAAKIAKMKGSLDECQEFCQNSQMNGNELKIFRTLTRGRKGEPMDLHCVLIHLHGKVHSKRSDPIMETDRRAMKLIRLIVEAYLKKGGGAGWKFCFFSSSIVADIAQNHVTKDIRNEAGACLVSLLTDKMVQKRPECRALLEQICSEVLFFPDTETRTVLIHFISKNQNLQDALPKHQHTKYLSSAYRTQRLEINKTTISTLNSSCFVNLGMFQRQKAAVKILYVKKQHLLEDNPEFQAKERLIREVYNMRQLNAYQHPNFPVLLGYDTESLPYHLITKFERWGNMLQLVRNSRGKNPQVLPSQLLTMLIDVTDALLYLEGLGLVHRAVMAENVLVGDKFLCKLSGLHSLQQIPNGLSSLGSASLNDYHRAECPPLDDDYLPRRWKAPECLTYHQYSTASDVWALGVLIYEVLTYGCTPYRHIKEDVEVDLFVVTRQEIVPLEECFETQEYELIKQCCKIRSQRRLKLSEVKIKLKEAVKRADFHHARPDPPPLELLPPPPPLPQRPPPHPQPPPTLFQSSAVQNEENVDIYSNISDDEEVIRDLVKKKVQGETEIWEKLWQEDDKHVKGLIGLKHPNLAIFLESVEVDSHYWIVSPASPNGDLKEYVLDRKCKLGDIVTYFSQVASALHYLHVNHIVHGDLRAEYVNVVAPNKVQVGRMGRSKSLTVGVYEVTSTSCVVQANMPRDAIRWSSPEVISDGLYTHASDVWSLGILAWELYTSCTAGQAQRDSSVPYYDLNDHEILPYMRSKGPLDRPENCPDWIHIIMHQCWAFDSAQRPPSLAIFDCLTSRKPMMTWIMQLWLGNHAESEWPDLDICQPEDACHVTDAEMHPSKQNVEKMCSVDFFEKHSYRYIDFEEKMFPRKSSKEDDDVDAAKCKRCQNGQDDHFSGTTHNEGYEDYEYYEGNDVPSSFDRDDCGKYDKPAEANNPQDSKHLAECLNVIQEIDDDYCSLYDMPVSNIPKARDNCAMYDVTPNPKRNNEEYQYKAIEMDEKDCSKYDKGKTNISKGEKKNENCQQKAHNMNQDACTIDEKPNVKRGNEEYQNKRGKQKKDRSIDNKPVACISEEKEKNENLQTRAPKLQQGVCPMYDKSAANCPDGGEGNGEYQNVLAFRKAPSFWTSLEDNSQLLNNSRYISRTHGPSDLPQNIKGNSPWKDIRILSNIVTSEGGLVVKDSVKLVCPPGAVETPVSVNITLVDPSIYYGLLVQKDLENDVMFAAPIINLEPSGHFFKKPLTLLTKFKMNNFKWDDVLILHGSKAGDGNISWQDITFNSKIDEADAEVIIEIEHFSLIAVLVRFSRSTLIRTKEIVSRLNLLSFNYTLSVLLNKSSPSSVHDELALLFVSQDVYHEQFYREDETSSALMQLKKDGFVELHVYSITRQEETSIYNNENLQIDVHLGEDYKLADRQQGKTSFTVHSYVWWNAGMVIRLPLEWKHDVRSLCGKISVQGEYGHTSERHFSERDLCGYARSLLGVEGAIFNLIPIAKLLEMPEESTSQAAKCWKDEEEQLELILQHWSKKNDVVKDLAALRKDLESLQQKDYMVTKRGQMHIRHLRKLATKISSLQCVNADSVNYFIRKIQTLCKSVLRDCCIELEGSIEAASSERYAEFLIQSIRSHVPPPEDIARKYQQVCSSSDKAITKTFLIIVPYLIQNIKDIFVDERISEVPQNGLRGMPKEKLDHFVSSVRNAEGNNRFQDLVCESCNILEQLCLKNHDKQPTAEIERWGKSLTVLPMLNFLKPFFQHSRQDVRLHQRLDLFLCRLRDIMANREDIDEVFVHDLSNLLLSLVHFAKFDPSKLVRFELIDSANFTFICPLENVRYDKHEHTYSQVFRIKKDSEGHLQLQAIARVYINGKICKKGTFQTEIILKASSEEVFHECSIHFEDVTVVKLKDNVDMENRRVVLCSKQKEKLSELLHVLKQKVRKNVVDVNQSKVTQCDLLMRTATTKAGVVVSLRLVYKWGSEAVFLDSEDFVNFADLSTGCLCTPEEQVVDLSKDGLHQKLSLATDKQSEEGGTIRDNANDLQILIQMMNGRKIALAVEPNDSIKNVKKKIQQVNECPPDRQRLVFVGKNLADDHILSDYNIQNGSTLILVQRLRDAPMDDAR